MAVKCQSCSMPLKDGPNNHGTESGGTLSQIYCSFCYEDGKFLQPDISVKEMQDICVAKLKEKGIPGPFAWLFTRGISKLDRWTIA